MRSDHGDGAKRCEQKKKNKTRGWGRGEKSSLFSPLLFFRSLPSRRTPLSERLEQDTSALEPAVYKVHGPVLSNGAVNSKCTHRPPPGYLLDICHLVGPGGGDLSENHFPGLVHLSILLEAVNVVPFSIFHQKIYLFTYQWFAPGWGGRQPTGIRIIEHALAYNIEHPSSKVSTVVEKSLF